MFESAGASKKYGESPNTNPLSCMNSYSTASKSIIVTGDFVQDWNLALVSSPEREVAISNIAQDVGGALLLENILAASLGSHHHVEGHYVSRVGHSLVKRGRTGESDLDSSGLEPLGGSLQLHADSFAQFERKESSESGLRPPLFDHQLLEFFHEMLERRASAKAERSRLFHRDFSKGLAERESWIQEYVSNAKRESWRIRERLGRQIHRRPVDGPPRVLGNQSNPLSVENEDSILVINDTGFGFSDCKLELRGSLPSLILYKLRFRPDFDQTPLWKEFVSKHLDRVIVITRAEDLRNSGYRLTKGISWEKLCTDFANILLMNRGFEESIARCRALIVALPRAGALMRFEAEHANSGRPDIRLIYDPSQLEGQWEKHYPGEMLSRTTTLTACIAAMYARADTSTLADRKLFERAMMRGVKFGLATVRYLHLAGYDDQKPDKPEQTILKYPRDDIASLIGKHMDDSKLSGYAARVFKDISVPTDKRAREDVRNWTILEQQNPDLSIAAVRIALSGLSCIEDVPILRYGRLDIVDRREIESYSSLQSLMENYLTHSDEKPLSFATFGQPGSGKTYGIRQMAKELSGSRHKIELLDFNLASFKDYKDLVRAFHVVRDKVFEGKTPLAFWDEFDSTKDDQPLFWLKYFLGPMQEGKFREEQVEHPIGPAIFVFAGGTNHTFREFGDWGRSPNQPRYAAESVKLPDFISRLRGHINILGMNPSDTNDKHDRDACFVRRAVFLRSFLKERFKKELFKESKDKKSLLHIHPQVLLAFLFTDGYVHGSRSMQALLSMCRLRNTVFFGPSSLPAREQMEGHVNTTTFMNIIYDKRESEDHFARLAIDKAKLLESILCLHK